MREEIIDRLFNAVSKVVLPLERTPPGWPQRRCKIQRSSKEKADRDGGAAGFLFTELGWNSDIDCCCLAG
jgi:hypothetical protein